MTYLLLRFPGQNPILVRMYSNLRVEDKLEGANNFRSWKHRILLILEENDLISYAKEDIQEPEEEEAKTRYKKNIIKR